MNEFDLIGRLHGIVSAGKRNLSRPGCIGIGDDAAVLTIGSDKQLVVTTDTLVAGVHFPQDSLPADIGYKSLAVNLSDLAAMGAEPAWFFLALTLPGADTDWLDAFASGMGELATASGMELAGGDTTSGPLSITVTALGLVKQGEALLRSTANAGDLVVVSGEPGLAALALAQWGGKQPPDDEARLALVRPKPRLALGRALRGRATACIDVSDGLSADLGHILESSRLGAELWLDRMPQPPAMRALPPEQRWNLQLGGGDDYELCFTLPQGLESQLPAIAAESGVALSLVGRMSSEPGLRILKPDGALFAPRRGGFDHFPDEPAASQSV
jgi:thiamine-monophosphate kinase